MNVQHLEHGNMESFGLFLATHNSAHGLLQAMFGYLEDHEILGIQPVAFSSFIDFLWGELLEGVGVLLPLEGTRRA